MAEAKDTEGDCSLRGTEGMRHFSSTLGEKTKPGMHIWPRLLAKSRRKLHPSQAKMENSVQCKYALDTRSWKETNQYFSAFLIIVHIQCETAKIPLFHWYDSNWNTESLFKKSHSHCALLKYGCRLFPS